MIRVALMAARGTPCADSIPNVSASMIVR